MEHIINAQYISDQQSRSRKRFSSYRKHDDDFGEIMAGFIPAENPDGAIYATQESHDSIITPHFPIHHIDSHHIS